MDYQYLTYETLDDGAIARIMLNRPEARNAQNRGMLVELNEAFLVAEADKEAVNQTMDAQGFNTALSACFTLHQLNHSHWASITNGEWWIATEEHGVPHWKNAPKVQPVAKTSPG